MKKRLVTLVMALVCALSVGTLTACNSGPSAEEVIREGISAEFDVLTDQESDEWAEMVADLDSGEDLAAYGIDPEAYLESMFDGFAYEITSVEVDEENDSAVCYVTMTCKSFGDILPRYEELLNELMQNPDIYSMSEEELNQQVGALLMQAVDEVEPKDSELALECSRDDEGTWTEDDSVEDEVVNALMS